MGKTQNNHNVNNMATRNIHGGKNLMFSSNKFGGALNIDIVKPSMKKISPPPKKHWRMTVSDSQQMYQIKIQTTVKMSYSLEICRLLERVNHRIKLH